MSSLRISRNVYMITLKTSNSAIVAVGGSRDPCSDIYSGTGGASEPETQAIVNFLQKEGNFIDAYLTIHSYGQMWLYPWGYTSALPDDYQDLVRPFVYVYEVGLEMEDGSLELKTHRIPSSMGIGYSCEFSSGMEIWVGNSIPSHHRLSSWLSISYSCEVSCEVEVENSVLNQPQIPSWWLCIGYSKFELRLYQATGKKASCR